MGTPFIKGPALKCLISTAHGNVFFVFSFSLFFLIFNNTCFFFFVQVEIKYADGSLERYSETVLFFHLPGYPHPDASSMTDGEIKATVQVTNDGRHFSNELSFVYLPKSKMLQ